MGNVPLYALTPGACSRRINPPTLADAGPPGLPKAPDPPGPTDVAGPGAFEPFGKATATTSGPFVAARVLAYGWSVVPLSASPSVSVAAPVAIASSRRIAWTGR